MNAHLVALTIDFETPGTDESGEYEAADVMPVRVQTDGETVSFVLPDGRVLYCDHEPLHAVVREPERGRAAGEGPA